MSYYGNGPKVKTVIKINTKLRNLYDPLNGSYLFGIVDVDGFFQFHRYAPRFFIEKKLPFSLLILQEQQYCGAAGAPTQKPGETPAGPTTAPAITPATAPTIKDVTSKEYDDDDLDDEFDD